VRRPPAPPLTVRLALLGHGRIGRIHFEAADATDGVAFVAVADVEGLPTDLDQDAVDAIVVATPTPTHAAVVDQLRQWWTGRIVVEKPAATSLDDVERLLVGHGVDLVYHAAFGPEVEWAVARLDRWREAHGDVVAVDQRLADAYAGDLERVEATLGNSWLDGGINALSVLVRFVEPRTRRSLVAVDGLVSTYEAVVDVAGGADVRIVTTWAAAEPSKRTEVTFADGARLLLDHQAVQGRLGDEWFASPGPPHRLVQHYVGCFGRLFVEGRRSFPVETDLRLHQLLLG
jgi:predicted dehydrogenase